MVKAEGFFFFFDSGFRTHVVATAVCATVCVHTLRVARACFQTQFLCVTYGPSRTRMAKGVCNAHVISLHLTLSSILFHPPSLLFPHGHFETTFPSAPSSSNCPRPESAGQAHFRTSGEECGHLADSTHCTGYEPKEFDEVTSVDGDMTPTNDPNRESISVFTKATRENIVLFGVPTVFETSVSQVFHGFCSSERKPRKHAWGNRCKTERKRVKRRFCDQCCRVDVKEQSTEQYWESFSPDSQRILF